MELSIFIVKLYQWSNPRCNIINFVFGQASVATKFRPLFDRVLVKRLDAVKQSKGGIMLPESASKKILEATVIAVGPGARNQVCLLARLCNLHSIQLCFVYYHFLWLGRQTYSNRCTSRRSSFTTRIWRYQNPIR